MARGNARRDAKKDESRGNEPPKCKHPQPWNARGPLKDNDGRYYTKYWCSVCDKITRTLYFDDAPPPEKD